MFIRTCWTWNWCDRASLVQRCDKPTRCHNFSFINFLNQPNMFRETNSPILRSICDCIYGFGTMNRHCCRPVPRGTGRQQRRCIVPKVVYTIKKCSWGWANLSLDTCWADLKRLKNEKVMASCWLFTSLLICWFICLSNSAWNLSRGFREEHRGFLRSERSEVTGGSN